MANRRLLLFEYLTIVLPFLSFAFYSNFPPWLTMRFTCCFLTIELDCFLLFFRPFFLVPPPCWFSFENYLPAPLPFFFFSCPGVRILFSLFPHFFFFCQAVGVFFGCPRNPVSVFFNKAMRQWEKADFFFCLRPLRHDSEFRFFFPLFFFFVEFFIVLEKNVLFALFFFSCVYEFVGFTAFC